MSTMQRMQCPTMHSLNNETREVILFLLQQALLCRFIILGFYMNRIVFTAYFHNFAATPLSLNGASLYTID